MAASLLALVGSSPAAEAVQASGDDAVVLQPGWSWSYATTLNYAATDATATINETVNWVNAGPTTFAGQPAYKLTFSGPVTGGSGSANGNNLTINGGNVTGTRYVRRSDLALLQETQAQHITGTAALFVSVTADFNITLTPSPSWKQHDFPLNPGDAWQVDESIAYDGSFTYDAGSLGGSGGGPMSGTIPFVGGSSVSNATISAGGNSSLATRLISSNGAGGAVDNLWWSPAFKTDAKEHMVLPLSDATLTIDRTLAGSPAPSTPAPTNSISETVTSSLSCAGGTVTVSGSLSTAASGQAVDVILDQSQISPGQTITASTTTGTNGNYSATLTVPAQPDGLQKSGSRANWGVLVSAPSANASNVATLVVTPQDCSTIAYTGPASGAQFGSTTVSAKLTDKADAAGAAGRAVKFTLAGGTSVTATTDSGGVATAALPIAGPPRSTTITAAFLGAADLEAASVTAPFTVTRAASATTVTPASPSVTIGDPLTFTAHVSPSSATGTVQFLVDGATFGAAKPVSGGTATSDPFGTGTLSLGNHVVKAVYNGDGDYNPSTSADATFRVHNPLLPTTTTEVATPSSVVSGQTVSLSADVSSAAGTDPITGTVTFSDGSTELGTVTLDGSAHAHLDVSTLSVGNHSIVAAYSGDDEVYNASSSSPATVTVAKADVDVVLASADTTTVTGEGVDLTATVAAHSPGAGVPTGTAQLEVDGVATGSPVALVAGAAAFAPVTTLGAGSHTIKVLYGGDAAFGSGSDSLVQHVAPAATVTSLVASPSPSSEDQDVTITATVTAAAPGSGAPTGTVLFTSDGDVIGAAPLSAGGGGSQASVTVSTLAPGGHTLVAWYAGDNDFLGSQSAEVSHTVVEGAAVVATSTSVSSSKNPSTYGELITFSAHVTAADDSTPTGSVQFSVDGTNVGDPVDLDGHGVAVSPALASPEPGDHTVIAAYLPPATYAASGDVLTQTVADAGVDVALQSSDASSDYGQAVHFTATVASQQVGTGTPTGFVQFSVDDHPLGGAVALSGGVATSPSISSLAPGSHPVTAVYSGDPHFVSRTATTTQSVAQVGTSTALAATPAAPAYGQAVTLTATVTPAAAGLGTVSGTVTFRDGSTVLGTSPVAASGGTGTASLVVTSLVAGTHHLTAAYSGSTVFAASTSADNALVVGKRATTMKADALVVRANPLLGLNVVTLRGTLTTSSGPLAGKTVVFSNGATTVCTGTTDASGLANCTPSLANWLALNLAGKFTATFAGDANYLGSTDVGTFAK